MGLMPYDITDCRHHWISENNNDETYQRENIMYGNVPCFPLKVCQQ